MNDESWCDIVKSSDTIDQKLQKLTKHIEEAACDTFDLVDVNNRPKFHYF